MSKKNTSNKLKYHHPSKKSNTETMYHAYAAYKRVHKNDNIEYTRDDFVNFKSKEYNNDFVIDKDVRINVLETELK